MSGFIIQLYKYDNISLVLVRVLTSLLCPPTHVIPAYSASGDQVSVSQSAPRALTDDQMITK